MYKIKKILAVAFCLLLMLAFIACEKEDSSSSSESSSSNITSNESSSNESSSDSEHTHVVEVIAGVEPTCTKTGLTEGEKCSVCGEILTAQETIKATGHSEKVLERVEPTCTKTGLTEGKKCSVCDEILVAQETLDATGEHKYENSYKCSNCDYELYKKSEGLSFTKSDDGTYYVVSGIGTCEDTNIVIPYTYDNLPVKAIGDRAFYDCDSLTSIIIPDSVSTIGLCAFQSCTSLTSIVIPNSISEIGEWAFYYCYNLVEVYNLSSLNISAGVEANGDPGYYAKVVHTSLEEESILETVDGYIFMTWEGKYYLVGREEDDAELTLPEGYKGNDYAIYSYTFFNCTNINKITIPDSVTEIGQFAFYGCYKLVEVYNLSSLNITVGTSTNGYVAGYARVVHTSLEEETILKTVDDYIFAHISDDKSYLVDYIGDETELTLPEGYKGNNYVIHNYAFFNRDDITKVIIPNSVTSIGTRAFLNCTSLLSVTIGNSVTTIGDYAFKNCGSLTSIIIPTGVTSIGSEAFEDCKKLVEVYNLSSLNVTVGTSSNGYVGYYAKAVHTSLEEESILKTTEDGYIFVYISDDEIYLFDYVGKDTELTLPEGYKGNNYVIHNYAFFNRDDITKVIIPNSVTSIGGWAFSGCTSLTSIEIPNSITVIGQWTFSNCASLTSIKISNGVTTIGEDAFSNCTSLTSIEIPDSLTDIGIWAFSGCTSLKSVKFGTGVTSIANGAFSDCTSLTSVTIPNSVTSIGEYSFKGCTSLTDVYIPTSIRYEAFADCTSLTSVTIGNGATSISSGAFSDCTSLKSVKIGTGVTSIVSGAFSGCTSIENIIIDSGNTTYKSIDGNIYSSDGKTLILYASGKTNESFVIPSGVTAIEGKAFADCTSLKSITITNDVTSIGSYAFSYCTSLKSVTIGTGVTSIANGAFSGCTSIENIIVDSGNTTYKSIDGNIYSSDGKTLILYASGKTNESFVIPNGVETIGDYAFADCTSLTSVTIPNSVTSIGGWAFKGCTSLTSIEIPNSIKTIGKYAFSNCTSLTSIEILNGVTTIGEDAFSRCTSLTSVVIPNSVSTMGNYAFSNCTSLTIYCEAEDWPSGWSIRWNSSSRPVVWGHTHTYENGECVCGKAQG